MVTSPRIQGGVVMIESLHGVTQMDKLNGEMIVILRETKGGVDLEVVPLP